MGNTNGKPTARARTGTTLFPRRASLRRYVLPFEASVRNTWEETGVSTLVQNSGARLQLEDPNIWHPFLDAVFQASGVPHPVLYNIQVRFLVEVDGDFKGTVSWIGPAAPRPLLCYHLNWFMNDRMSQYGVQDEDEGWWCYIDASVAGLRINPPRLNDYPLQPVQPAWMEESMELERGHRADLQIST